MNSVNSDEDLMTGVSLGTESNGEDDPPIFSDAAMSGGQDQHGDTYEEGAIYGSHLPTQPPEQDVESRPCPTPRYRMPEATVDVADEGEHAEDFGEPQLRIGVAPIEDGARGEAGNIAESETVVETRRRYPRRLNKSKSKLQFTFGIDR